MRVRCPKYLLALVFLGLLLPIRAANLLVSTGDTRGWLRISSAGGSNQVHTLEASPDLRRWLPAAILHDGPFDFADVTAPTNTYRYFRLVSRTRTPEDDGKNQIYLPHDPFLATAAAGEGESGQGRPLRWVKFSILLNDEARVWFQDSVRHPFHFDYARLRLPPLAGMARLEFDRRTLYRTNRLAVLGAVLLPGEEAGNEYGIQFVGQDEFAPEEILRWFRLVEAAVLAPPGAHALYMPTYEQAGVAQQHREWLSERGIEVANADRWLASDAVYSPGWAVGRLTFVPAGQIATAYASGQLRPTDILLTDAVPAEVPYVSGIITLTPATPNSHVAILAQGYRVPFLWFSLPEVRTNLVELAGREIALRTGSSLLPSQVVEVTDLPVGLSDTFRQLKLPPPLNYAPKQRLGAIATNVASLTPSAIEWVGGKAANYGLLRRTIPSNSEPALALTFDLWDDFLAQTLPNGRTLRAEIGLQLGGLTYPPDFAAVRTRLASLRDLIRQTARFSPAQQSALLSVLTNAGFDPARKLRFRSSTNVEDSDDFTGAGLYDSYSGCLLDDLDNETTGPSQCDSGERNERGVFRAVQRVYASFYNENAFLERLRRGVKEDEVGMAVLVHHSFPDANELANGVATLRWRKPGGITVIEGELVTQLGAESVTNPEGSARPEVVGFFRQAGTTSLFRRQASTLVPLGGMVMTWETDYRDLIELLVRVADGYSALFPGKTEFELDLEYKRMTPGRLDVKQVRPLPKPEAGAPVARILLPQPTTLTVQETSLGSPLAKHRLKLRLALQTDARQLTTEGYASSFYRDAALYRASETTPLLTGELTAWPGASHQVKRSEVEDRWVLGADANRREFVLRTLMLFPVRPPTAPWVTQQDLTRWLDVRYGAPQPELHVTGVAELRLGWTTNDNVALWVRPPIDATSLPQERAISAPQSGVQIVTRFFWPAPPKGDTAGYTAPNLGFTETRITGLTTEPILLRDVRSQTYSPWHHNSSETFIFEPAADPGVTSAQRTELAARDIHPLVATVGSIHPALIAVRADGSGRTVE